MLQPDRTIRTEAHRQVTLNIPLVYQLQDPGSIMMALIVPMAEAKIVGLRDESVRNEHELMLKIHTVYSLSDRA